MNENNFLTPDVVVWIHPINISEHPTYRPGYRWAVHVGGMSASDLKFCCQAGREDTQHEARITGESHGVAMCKAIRLFGIPVRYSVNEISWDPIPGSVDTQPTEVWDGMLRCKENVSDC